MEGPTPPRRCKSSASESLRKRRSSRRGRMATPGPGIRSTRKLRQWIVEQVESGKFSGLVWDDPAKTMFRIPWKHAGKQEFRLEEDAGFFKAWAIFKGKYRQGERFDPAVCKTRVRCALAKSPEFEEMPSRSRLDIPEPYKVYRLVPLSEQPSGNSSRKSKKMKREASSGTSEEEGRSPPKSVPLRPRTHSLPRTDGSATSEATASPSLNAAATLTILEGELSPQPGEPAPEVTEIALCVKAETVPAAMPLVVRIGEFSIQMSVFYSGVLVLSFWLPQGDFLITSVAAPLGSPCNRMHRVVLPRPDGVEDPRKQKATLQLLKDLEKGVMADSNPEGIFIQCQGKCKADVCWRGHTASRTSGKLDRDNLLHVFSPKAFESAWDRYLLGLATKPEHQVTLCVGEELEENDQLNNKLIIIQMAQNFAARRLMEVKEMPDLDSFVLSLKFPQPSA